MATAKQTTVTLRNSRRRQTLAIALLAVPGIASANCGASILFPTPGLKLLHLDTVTVTYRSTIANPSLSCWCGAPGRAIQS